MYTDGAVDGVVFGIVQYPVEFVTADHGSQMGNQMPKQIELKAGQPQGGSLELGLTLGRIDDQVADGHWFRRRLLGLGFGPF